MAKKKKKGDKKDKLRFIRLGWEILGHKFLYYEGANHGLKPTSDDEYDACEEEYKALAKKLGKKPRATDMVGFYGESGAPRMVMEDLIFHKGKFPAIRIASRKAVREITTETRKKVNVYLEELLEVLEEVGLKESKIEKIKKLMKKRMKV